MFTIVFGISGTSSSLTVSATFVIIILSILGSFMPTFTTISFLILLFVLFFLFFLILAFFFIFGCTWNSPRFFTSGLVGIKHPFGFLIIIFFPSSRQIWLRFIFFIFICFPSRIISGRCFTTIGR